jgi:ribosomal protein RSM22 (predicted rRNA methylase)
MYILVLKPSIVTRFALQMLLSPLVHSLLYHNTTAELGSLLQHLKEQYPGWYPSIILDIGANQGRWSMLARKIYPKSKVLMVEASKQHIPTLQPSHHS